MRPDSSSGESDRTGARVAVGSRPGYIFAAEGVDILCFVPADLVSFGPAGEARVDLTEYVRAGWSQRNARGSDGEAGEAHAFPDGRRLIDPRSVPNLRAQLERWRRLAESAAPSGG